MTRGMRSRRYAMRKSISLLSSLLILPVYIFITTFKMLTHIVNFSILRRKLLQIAGKGPSLSPVLTVPVLPRLAPVKTSQYTVINRGTFPCSHSHGVAPVLPRQAGVTRLYYLYLTSLTVKPGCIKNFNHTSTKSLFGIKHNTMFITIQP